MLHIIKILLSGVFVRKRCFQATALRGCCLA